MKPTKTRTVVGLFYGRPAALIQKWCLVSKQTAEHYKSGRRTPSSRVMRLFQLYSQNKILGNEWRGWQIIGNRLIPPNGRGFTQTQLAAYEYVWQLAHEANRDEAYALLEKLSGD